MSLKIFESKGLAHYSYYLSDKGEAIVVDPRRDCDVYVRTAETNCTKIKYILETHRNEDYVIGSLELQNLIDAEIGHSKETSFEYGDLRLEDGDSLQIGDLEVRVIHTPGHTNDSLCFAVYSVENQNTPLLLFSGDTLFAGDVGRTDLLGYDNIPEQSGKLFESLQKKIYPLGKHVQVYPAHGGGSVCGHDISNRPNTTIGYEWKTNPFLTLEKDQFIETLVKQDLLKPPYFEKMELLNLKGPPLIESFDSVSPLDINKFEQEMNQTGTIIIDTREVGAFAGCHIPGSINIWLDGMSFYPGWIISYNQKILLLSRKEDVNIAERYLRRLGFDEIIGYLCPGIKSWRNAGKKIDHLGTLSVIELRKKLDKKEVNLLDVRTPNEWNEGHIEGASQIYVGELSDNVDSLSKDKPIAVLCSVGDRGGLGASILKREGFDVYNVLGGITAWKRLNYPLKTD